MASSSFADFSFIDFRVFSLIWHILLSHVRSSVEICPAEQWKLLNKGPEIMEMCILLIHFSLNSVILNESLINCSVSISMKYLWILVVIRTISTPFCTNILFNTIEMYTSLFSILWFF
jgi:hypothetical protein